MIEELNIKLKSRDSYTKKPLTYEANFIFKKENLNEIMNKFSELFSFEHLDCESLEEKE